MILILASSLYEDDPQIELLVDSLIEKGKKFRVINSLDHNSLAGLCLVQEGKNIVLVDEDGENISPSKIFISRLVRSDCVIEFPPGCIYTTMYRQKVESFVREIVMSFPEVRIFPGNWDSILKAEVKSYLLGVAFDCGLSVPPITKTCFGNPGSDFTYRKVLGYPFSISFNKRTREEIALTMFNGQVSTSDDHFCLPWQWQTEIKTSLHIRCVVVGSLVRAYVSNWKLFPGEDLRSVQENVDLVWAVYTLPKNLEDKVFSLMNCLGLEFACPEFLVDQDGNHVFIDLNPCGDWYGFVNEDENILIAKEIVKKL